MHLPLPRSAYRHGDYEERLYTRLWESGVAAQRAVQRKGEANQPTGMHTPNVHMIRLFSVNRTLPGASSFFFVLSAAPRVKKF